MPRRKGMSRPTTNDNNIINMEARRPRRSTEKIIADTIGLTAEEIICDIIAWADAEQWFRLADELRRALHLLGEGTEADPLSSRPGTQAAGQMKPRRSPAWRCALDLLKKEGD